MSYLERKDEPHGREFKVTVAFGADEFFTWEGYADLAGHALCQAEMAYGEQRAEMFPDPEYDELEAQWRAL